MIHVREREVMHLDCCCLSQTKLPKSTTIFFLFLLHCIVDDVLLDINKINNIRIHVLVQYI